MKDTIPDRTAPLIGWRIWRTHKGRLTGTIVRSRWPVDAIEAKCEMATLLPNLKRILGPALFDTNMSLFGHPAPEPACSCGIYAAESLEALLKAQPDIQSAGLRPLIVGQIEMWGRVIKHDNGVYRAERARVKTLCYAPGQRVSRFKVAALAKFYGASVTTISGVRLISWRTWVAVTLGPPLILLALLLQTGHWNPLRLITMTVTGLDSFMVLWVFLAWQQQRNRFYAGLTAFWVLLVLMQFA